ncbi:MAG: hypothetical protein EBY17_08400 [Acidobacteriia bacterium]|nr:hypothetical protein [Terriglobia bacterium]
MRAFQLILCGLLYGFATGWLFHRYSNQPALRRALNRIVAHILEFRLFIDEPRLIFRAQRELIRANLGVLRAVAIPLLAATALLAVVWVPLQSQFGKAPMEAGDVLLARVESVADGIDLVTPFGVAIETPALRLPTEAATVWRVRILSPVSGEFRTSPHGPSVELSQAPATFFGMPWWLFYGISATVASCATMRPGSQIRP